MEQALRAAARQLLAPSYGWFSEDKAGLQAADGMLRAHRLTRWA